MTTAVDWGTVGGIASVIALGIAIIGFLARYVVVEVRLNRHAVDEVKRKVTTPASNAGTIGETVARLAENHEELVGHHDNHRIEDDFRISQIWRELGKAEPRPRP
jgi:hypothetical protein